MQCSTQELADMAQSASASASVTLRKEIIHELQQRKRPAAKQLLSALTGEPKAVVSAKSLSKPDPSRGRALKVGTNVHRPKHAPTPEQSVAIAAFATGGSLGMRAFAGAGKTSTLQFFADYNSKRGLYLAFNKAIATEAQRRFPSHVTCCTTHSLASRFVRGRHGYADRKLFQPIHAKELAQVLALKDLVIDAQTTLTPVQQAHTLLQGIRRFCNSDAAEMSGIEIDLPWRLRTTDSGTRDELKVEFSRQCAALWERMTAVADPIPLGHDGYLKLWSLSEPVLDHSYVFVDEAQDTNKAVLGVFKQQRDTQMVYVGDEHQQIYEWRQAVNAMNDVATDHKVELSQSFRFGPEIASAANRVLRTLGETNTLRGFDKIDSHITTDTRTRAVLARTNATVISEALAALEQDRTPHIVGGTSELKDWLSDAKSLMDGLPGQRPEFFGFTNWQQVVDFAGTDEGESVRRFVTLVQANGTGRLWQAVLNATDQEERADVVISTAHKAKGCEWESVRIAEDFASCKSDDENIPAAEARLFYVAITRAKQNLSIDPNLLAAFSSGRMADLEKLKAVRASPERSTLPKPRLVPPLTVDQVRVPTALPQPSLPPAAIEVTASKTSVSEKSQAITSRPPPKPDAAKPKGFFARIVGW